MIVAHMFELSKSQVMNFICDVLETGSNTHRKGFFKADLAFNEQGKFFSEAEYAKQP